MPPPLPTRRTARSPCRSRIRSASNGTEREFLDLLVDDIDILLGNEEEITMLFGAASHRAALEAAEETGLLVVMTRGAAGCVVLTAHGPEEVPAAPVGRVVDTTGAGDLFAAGMLYGLTHGMDPVLERAARWHLRGRDHLAHRRPSRVRPARPRRRGRRARTVGGSVSLSIGIVGLPNVGKSTLFNALTNNEVLAANYPFATIDPNVGVVAVPDHRLEELAALYDGAPIVPASVTFVDIAGIVRGASQGEGLGNKFLAAIRESDAICQVVRVFHDDDVIHVDGRVDPDVRHRHREHRADPGRPADRGEPAARSWRRKRRARPELRAAAEAVAVAQRILDEGRTISSAAAQGEVDVDLLYDLHLLTAKPFIYVFNVDEDALTDTALAERLAEGVAPASSIVLCAQIEAELARMPADDARELLESYGLEESGLERLDPCGLCHPGPPDLPDRRPKGGAGLDHPRRRHRAQGGRRHPYGLREGLHQGRSRELRGPGGDEVGGCRTRRREGAHGGQGLRHA